MRRILVGAVLVLVAAAFVVAATGASNGSSARTYHIEVDNSFGLVPGADFKVAGVPAGKIAAITLDRKTLHAVVTVTVTSAGFGQFHQDVSCETRPESLIGEYYVDCNPGTQGPVIKSGSTISVSHTQSTIPADLLLNTMRLPYRQRFSLIINELGAAAAARSGDLQSALRRAVPALTETDNLLNLLAGDSHTLQNLTRDSDSVITALANNNAQVARFIDMANRTSTATATQDNNLRLTFQNLPGVLEQLRPAMAKLGRTVTTNQPVLNNLNAASSQLNRLFTDLPAFSRSARPAIKSLGQASVTGRQAVIAAKPTVTDLNRFAKPTPELANNLSIVLRDLDTQKRAVEKDPRSPGGKGFSGLQALLGYAFNQALAINTFTPQSHVLAVDAFFDKECSPYATPAFIAMALKAYGPSYRHCYAFLGPNQPGVTTKDPSDPSAPIPDPNGAGKTSAADGATQLTAADVLAMEKHDSPQTGGVPSANSTSGNAPAVKSSAASVGQSITGTGTTRTAGSAPRTSSKASTSSTGGAVSSKSAQTLLNYLLAP
jgi:virulence factor Mce-like protein